MREMTSLYTNFPELERYFETCFTAIHDFTNRPDVKEQGVELFSQGFELKRWLSTGEMPDLDYTNRCCISFVANQIVQLGYLHLVNERGFSTKEMFKYTAGVAGHSQGLQAAATSALALEGDAFLQSVYDFVVWFGIAGFHIQYHYGFPTVREDLVAWSLEHDGDKPTQMAVTDKITEAELTECVDEFNRKYPQDFPVRISMVNTETVLVVTGHAESLVQFRQEYLKLFQENGYTWNYLPVSAPFHRPDFEMCIGSISHFTNDEVAVNFKYKPSDLVVPVYSFYDGSNLQEHEDLSFALSHTMLFRELYWSKAIAPMIGDDSITHVIDFGPGKISALLTRGHLKGKSGGPEVLSVVGKAGLRKMTEG